MSRVVGIAFIGLAMAACSDKRAAAPADQRQAGATNPAGASGGATTDSRCPLTAAQVSAALGGAKLNGPDSSCSFYPPDEAKLRPNVTYVKQVSFACSGNNPAEDGYSETVDGLGSPAYVSDRADGSWILVCRGGAPFEIRVDAGGKEAARAAATALVHQLLATR